MLVSLIGCVLSVSFINKDSVGMLRSLCIRSFIILLVLLMLDG